ncbi:MAG: hypothetical protein BGO39_12290 [Chloroflexi bacterium 54-19]|nr:MAG: hypothetical protein BGO39_12290 [Chloroflexi bacterium 54-19]
MEKELTQTNDYNRSGYILVGTFDDVKQAEQVVYDLKGAGFPADAVSLAAKDMSSLNELKSDEGKEATDGAVGGAIGGGALGAALGWLLAGGTALIPGIGPIVAAGIFTATVGGALIGGTLGGVAGALVASGLPEEQAREYEENLKSGRVLVVVKTPDAEALVTAKQVFALNQSSGEHDYAVAAGNRADQTGSSLEAATPADLPPSQGPDATPNSLINQCC